jgi:hypothetical protein
MFGMNGHPWHANPSSILLLLAFYFVLILLVISRISGWARLSERFGATEPFLGEIWNWQSARFRGWCNYNNSLKVGANLDGLYIAPMFTLRLFHPPLLIPWREIEVETGKLFFGYYDTVRFRLGTEERVTMRIYGKLVNRVREAAGPGWPLYSSEQLPARSKS